MDDKQSNAGRLGRRGVLLGAGVAGVAAVAVAKLAPQAPAAAAGKAVETVADAGEAQEGGYRLTAHVQRYYQTTKI
ncbi:formate dehydrogenase [Caldimonas sp. KR1-144]|uniref:formate dehydrogenase n=1 Tax=Caldimonas sp. KR1-144 TaxID=3400911 RepID=UPI003BFDA1D9